MDIVTDDPPIEGILAAWEGRIGVDYPGYRGHVYRMFHFCLALQPCSEGGRRKLAIAACFHDIGLWSDHTVDYTPPSVAQVGRYLAENGLDDWAEEISLMVEWHHKRRPWRDDRYPLVERFRQADLVDFSLGLFRCGLSRA